MNKSAPQNTVSLMSREVNYESLWINVPNGRVLLSRRFIPGSNTTGGWWQWVVAVEICDQ